MGLIYLSALHFVRTSLKNMSFNEWLGLIRCGQLLAGECKSDSFEESHPLVALGDPTNQGWKFAPATLPMQVNL